MPIGPGPGRAGPINSPSKRLLNYRWKVNAPITNDVGITNSTGQFARLTDTVGTASSVALTGVYVQFDTWRPAPKPDNSLVLVCRTPEGTHDSDEGAANMTLWALHPEGTWERPCVQTPANNGYGWDTYRHPEWSPDGTQIVLMVETADEWKIVTLDSSGFGQ